jgi:hypothetical protein
LELGDLLDLGKTTQETPIPDDFFAKLSQLNLDMARQLRRISHGRPMVDMDYLITPTDKMDPKSPCPIDDMMASTRYVIEILEMMCRASKVPPSHSDDSSPAQKTGTFPARRKSGVQTLATPQESHEGLPEPSGEPRSQVDVTILLLIVNCYTHVLRLYVVLFFHIYEFLNELAKSEDPTLCPIPGLAFGAFPLCKLR